LPEYADRQIADFAKNKGLSEDLVKALLIKTHDDRKAVRNAERMILGKKFKAVLGQSQPRRARPKKNVSESEEDDEAAMNETEDIFIDDCIQMRAPKRKKKAKMPFANLIKKELQD